jgi:hypothetical protein
LARTDEVVVALLAGTVYSTGIVLQLAVRRRPRPRRDLDDEASDEFFPSDPLPPPFGPYRRVRPGRELPPEVLRFGVQFADGQKATTVGDGFPWRYGLDEDEEEPPGPVLMQGGGGGGNGDWQWEFWLWPMPPPGPLAFVVEWPAEEIELTRHELDAALFRDAAANSEVLWPDANSAPRLGGGSVISQIVGSEDRRPHEKEPPQPDNHEQD